MALLENLAAEEGDPVAVGLRQQLLQYQVVATLHLLADALAETNHLSRVFQCRDVNFGSVPRHVSRKNKQFKMKYVCMTKS